MKTFSRILSVIDPTVEVQPAMRRAAWLASSSGAELELFICYYNEYMSGDRFFDSNSLSAARREVLEGYEMHLEQLAEPLRKDGIKVTTAAAWDHPLHEGIVRHAAAINADMVFKDTHHHSAFTRTLLTNTDWNLIRACVSPLWLVKPIDLLGKPVIIAAIDPMNENDKPAALDDEILGISTALADATGATVHAFHSYDPRIALASATANAYIPVSLPFDEIEKEMRTQHEKRFNEITEFHEIDRDKLHLVSGLANEELPELARKLDASVVVMGAVARNRLKRLFVGATAERTLEHLPCDLVIVKPDWFRTPVDVERDAAA
ncbi:MAG TPA: universal stress protein [Woeseiaceae bacterium]|nr:universal stress protein [Woeseiaceae bacterium]